MGKNEKMIIRKLEGVHVRKDGGDYKIIFGELGMTVLEYQDDSGSPTAFYWDWAEVGKGLAYRVEQPSRLKAAPHAQPGGVPQGISPR